MKERSIGFLFSTGFLDFILQNKRYRVCVRVRVCVCVCVCIRAITEQRSDYEI